MNFFGSVRTTRKLLTAWEYRSRSTIWRIYPTGSDWIVGEERDSEKKKATFFSLNRFSGKVIWSKELIGEWWVGVEAVTEDSIFLHGFATPDMPMHKGITSVDVLTGDFRWEQPDLCFERRKGHTIIGSRGAYGNKRYTSVETRTGRVLEEWADTDGSMSIGREDESLARVLFPETTFDVGENIRPVAHQFLKDAGQSGPVSWTTLGPFAVVAYQVDNPTDPKGQPTQYIAVIRISDNTELFSDIISTGTGMFIPDSFLIQDGMLYYVRMKNHLVALDLRNGPDKGCL